MSISDTLTAIEEELKPYNCRLVAVSKTHPPEKISEAYEHGQRIFGENKVQELTDKHPELPQDIQWHMIGHLQRNKVKYIAPFIAMVESADSLRLLNEINKQAQKYERSIPCLLQVHIADEESKYGLSYDNCEQMLKSAELEALNNVRIKGLMGMATLTEDREKVRKEFRELKKFFERMANERTASNVEMKELSMGMSHDYDLALEEGSTLVRIGSRIFGERNYSKD